MKWYQSLRHRETLPKDECFRVSPWPLSSPSGLYPPLQVGPPPSLAPNGVLHHDGCVLLVSSPCHLAQGIVMRELNSGLHCIKHKSSNTHVDANVWHKHADSPAKRITEVKEKHEHITTHTDMHVSYGHPKARTCKHRYTQAQTSTTRTQV